ncbi:single-stranded DNA-binding protein [Bifidobacterium choloepi]|uniref:Single-stranded DNA-binding protein n=1 Tax=Bifidobacterium choloepi TaxID=2614131 RepID=A0A6I5N066_9BIFI|nr:single-stranded DNA-binding protein [Bifidobacterium choloepi]NEG69505.1 single-stranded DNA-binding protein [Bifidobacterium choloepi]
MALQQGLVTITGRVGGEPQKFERDGEFIGCQFRLGCTRSYMGRNGEWCKMPTTWITVKAFRTLGKNVMMSIHKGEAVFVHGLLNTDEWMTQAGEPMSRIVIEATVIGHDLNFYVSEAKRLRPASAPANDQQPDGQNIPNIPNNQNNQSMTTNAPLANSPVSPALPVRPVPGDSSVTYGVPPADSPAPPGSAASAGRSLMSPEEEDAAQNEQEEFGGGRF